MKERERLARTAEDRRSSGGGEPTAPGPALLQLQRSAGNHAVVRTLARQDHHEDGAPALAKPGEQPLHQQQFDAFVAAVCANSDPAALGAARTACDGPAQSGEQTLEYGGRKLIVDQRNRTAVLTRIRWRAMDRIHELSETHAATERGAADEAGRDAARTALLTAAKPYIAFLEGPVQDPQSAQDRFQHWYDAVQNSVQRVLQLQVVEEARKAGLKADGTGKTRSEMESEVGRLKDAAWCGAFADYAIHHAGVGPAAAPGQLDGERGILAFMNYEDPISKKKIRDGDRTVSVKDYHASRNSLRRIQVVSNEGNRPGFTTAGGQAVSKSDVQVNPGDILLLDNLHGLRPDHVMLATSSDIGAMSRIAGNEGNTPGQVASGGAFDIRHQPDSITPEQQRPYDRKVELTNRKEAAKKDPGKWTDAHERELAEVTKQIADFERTHPKQSRIAAVCRFSIVDFETHEYA
jgi:hypothetical protein